MSENPARTADRPSAVPPPAPASAPGRAGGEEAGIRLLTDLRAEIAHADNKAAVLVAALGIAVGTLGGLLTNGSRHPQSFSSPGLVLFTLGTICLVTALLALLLAVLPRYRRSSWVPGRPLVYFGDIRRAAERGQLGEALVDAERAPSAGLIAALTDTSLIVSRKHLWVRVGLISFGLGALMVPSALLLG